MDYGAVIPKAAAWWQNTEQYSSTEQVRGAFSSLDQTCVTGAVTKSVSLVWFFRLVIKIHEQSRTELFKPACWSQVNTLKNKCFNAVTPLWDYRAPAQHWCGINSHLRSTIWSSVLQLGECNSDEVSFAASDVWNMSCCWAVKKHPGSPNWDYKHNVSITEYRFTSVTKQLSAPHVLTESQFTGPKIFFLKWYNVSAEGGNLHFCLWMKMHPKYLSVY